ncbi:DENN domain-containing protein 2A-like isoform X2 [Leptidea sinapis]|nr:DENN domain-containing protein 2A-like isoform X2 [Leptidea sinapis]
MTEIYETVTAACNMDENKPGSFPTDLSDTTSEESVKLTRSLTEKRKNYVRRVSSRVAYLEPKNSRSLRYRHQTSICSYRSEVVDNPYCTFRSWKSFRTSQSNLAKKMDDAVDANLSVDSEDVGDNVSVHEKAGCVDIELPFVPRERGLFNVCLLVGLNYMSGQAYVKSVFPSQVQVPPHIENLIFPETLSPGSLGEWTAEKTAQCYSLVLTDERGERSYGYCRRVLPEGATTCLPLCYCLIGKYRSPGFYYKILQEIESHHGNPEIEINQILQQLFETDFPNSGEQITITYNRTEKREKIRNSPNSEVSRSRTMPRSDCSINIRVRRELETESEVEREKSEEREIQVKRESLEKHVLPDFYDLENNNAPKRVMISLGNTKTSIIKRPIEPRADEDNMSILLDSFGAGLVVKVFGSLLLERKVIIMSDQLGLVSSCMEALQSALYPFVWQQPLISTIPSEIQRDVLEAPLPILAGMITDTDYTTVNFEEGMLIDLRNPSKVIFYQGDESTILPTNSYKTLKTSLQMETNKQKDGQDTKTRNVMISEAFLRFFVDILGDFWRFFEEREMKDGDLGRNGVVFDKDAFVRSTSSKQNQYFLEWFTETAMFTHFIQNMAVAKNESDLVDTPLPSYYELFKQRVQSRTKMNSKSGDKNYKSAVNKKVRMLKNKLRDLVA